MPAVKPYKTPWESAQALVADHALAKYGIADADPLRVVTELVFAPSEPRVAEDGTVYWTGATPELRLAAAKTLLKYTRPEVRAIHMHVEGQVDVDVTHKAQEATQRAKQLLSMLGATKYEAGRREQDVEEAVLVDLPPESTQH
jgi:hypothetical protein